MKLEDQNIEDQNEINEFWDRQTDIAHDCINDVVRHAQDHAYGLGLKRGRVEAEAAIIEVGQLKQSLWPMKDQEIARWKDAYENMRDFAVKSGLDITCYGAESV